MRGSPKRGCNIRVKVRRYREVCRANAESRLGFNFFRESQDDKLRAHREPLLVVLDELRHKGWVVDHLPAHAPDEGGAIGGLEAHNGQLERTARGAPARLWRGGRKRKGVHRGTRHVPPPPRSP